MLNNKTTKNTWKQVIYAEWRFFFLKKKKTAFNYGANVLVH